MKMRTKSPEKERAAHLRQQAAAKNNLHDKAYRKAVPLSNLKLAIGELLLFGNRQREEFWLLFESLLAMQYRSVSQSGLKGRETAPESKNSSQRVVG